MEESKFTKYIDELNRTSSYYFLSYKFFSEFSSYFSHFWIYCRIIRLLGVLA